MRIRDAQNTVGFARDTRRFGRLAFTLVEVVVSLAILAMVLAGVCYGYSEANRIAIWDSMSQAAQSFALEGMEQARAALWNRWDSSTNSGYGTEDELTPETYPVLTNSDWLDIPMKGFPYSSTYTNYTFYCTNYVYVYPVTNYASGSFPSNFVREIESFVVWTFPLTEQSYTNAIVTLRASDQ